jgi:hypothetical protein
VEKKYMQGFVESFCIQLNTIYNIEVLILDSKDIYKGSEEPVPGRWHLSMP